MSKITINKLNDIVSNVPTDKVKIPFKTSDGNEVIVEVKQYLSLYEISDIVDTVASGVFSDTFIPEYRYPLFMYKIMDTMTNIPTPMTKDKKIDFAKVQEIADKLELRDKIINSNNRLWDLITDLEQVIDEKIEFQKSLICHPDRDNDIVNAVVGFFDKLNSVVSNLEKNFGNIDMEKALPVIGDMAKNIAEGKVLSRENINTILEVGSTSKVGSENVTNLEVVK